jgi:hypothetical protein
MEYYKSFVSRQNLFLVSFWCFGHCFGLAMASRDAASMLWERSPALSKTVCSSCSQLREEFDDSLDQAHNLLAERKAHLHGIIGVLDEMCQAWKHRTGSSRQLEAAGRAIQEL